MAEAIPEVSVVVPVFREEATIPALVEQVARQLDACGATHEILLIDDGSPGATWDAVMALSQRYPQVRGLRLSRNFGKEAALCAGLEHARGRAVLTMDGDLQHPPSAIPEMLRRWRSGEAVIVDGVKLEPSRPRSWAFYAVFRTLSGVDLDRASDFKLLDRKAVDAWRAMGDRNLFYRGMAHWVGFRRSQVTFEVADRGAGATRWSIVRLMRLAAHAVVAFSSAPLQVATAMGLAFFLFALALGAQTLFLKLSGHAVSGFATVILLLLLIGSLVLLSLGVIGQYIAAIYDEVKGRPRYLIADTVGSGAPRVEPEPPRQEDNDRTSGGGPPEPPDPPAPPAPAAPAAPVDAAPDSTAPDGAAPAPEASPTQLAWMVARTAAALAGLAACGMAMLRYLPKKEAGPLVWSMVAAAVLLGLGLGLPAAERISRAWGWRVTLPRSRTASLALGGVMLVAAALFLFGADPPHDGAAWLLYLAGLACVVAAFWPDRGEEAGQPVARWELAALLLIVLIGAVLRFHRLTVQPYGIWYDEAQNVLEATRILTTSSYRPVFVADLSQMPALFFYIVAAFVKLLGSNVLAVRVTTTVAALGSLVALWALGRRLFGPVTGLFAAALLAVCRWHLGFSRFGMAMIFTSLVVPLVLWLFHRSQERRSAREAVLAGVALGFGIQLYYSMLAVPLLLVLYAVHRLVAARKGAAPAAALLGLTLVSSALTYAPVLQYARANREAYLERMRTVSAVHAGGLGELVRLLVKPGPQRSEALAVIARTTRKHAAMFHLVGDSNGRHNLPAEPMLERALGVLFVIGLLWCLARFWQPRCAVLLLWFAAMMASGILSLEFEAPQAARTLGATSVIALFAALPLSRLWEAFPIPGPGRWLGKATAIALLCASGSEARTTFFEKQLWDASTFGFWSAQETKIGRVLAVEGKQADIYVPEALAGGPTEQLLTGGAFSGQPFDEGKHLPLTAPRKAIVFLQGTDLSVVEQLRRFYPAAHIEPFGVPAPDGTQGEPLLWIIRISAADIAALRGWQVEASSGGSTVTRTAPSAEWRWDEWPAPRPLRARIAGYLKVETAGPYDIQLENPGPAVLEVDSERALSARGRVGLRLAAGLHRVALSLDVPSSGGSSSLSWSPPSGAPVPIDPGALFLPRLSAGGLVGRYFAGGQCVGTPAIEKVDSRIAFYFHFLPLQRPFSICWSGSLSVPEAGAYLLGTASVDGSSLRLDGKEVLTNRSGGYQERRLELTAGWHPLEVQYQAVGDYSQVYFYWTPPGKERVIVPAEDLRPQPPEVLSGR